MSRDSYEEDMYKEYFHKGFVHQNAANMVKCNLDKEIGLNVPARWRNEIEDIEGYMYYVSSKKALLQSLLPAEHRLSDNLFLIEEVDRVFFEFITQSDENLGKVPLEYIEEKVNFHKNLICSEAYDLQFEDPSKHVLVLCFNGADNVAVAKVFNRCCMANGIRGVCVYINSVVAIQWDNHLTISELQIELAEIREMQKKA